MNLARRGCQRRGVRPLHHSFGQLRLGVTTISVLLGILCSKAVVDNGSMKERQLVFKDATIFDWDTESANDSTYRTKAYLPLPQLGRKGARLVTVLLIVSATVIGVALAVVMHLADFFFRF
jgi:hypothetical protein